MTTTKAVVSITIYELNVHSKLKVTEVLNITSNVFVNDTLHVTSLASRRIVEALGVMTSGEIKGNTFKNKGMATTKDIDVFGSMKIKGAIKAYIP